MGAGLCGSWLACDAGTSVYQCHRGDAIAGKPAPTQAQLPHFLIASRLKITRQPWDPYPGTSLR
ncbi:hypothetical protein DJ480_26070 [Pseudomonas sp. Leaf98]|nr:hypothetical protein DJ480_26070 [Pseudomonas sp. Leaf98]